MKNYQPYEIQLANEIAETLNDKYSIDFFLQCARKYKESFLRDMVARAMAMDERKVEKSRGALFTSLIQRYGEYPSSRR